MSDTEATSAYEFGEWLIEPHLNRIRRDSEETQLQPKTVDVLEYLLEHAGDIVSLDELLDNVWAGRVVEPNVIHRNVTRIRSVLGDDPRNPRYIETISKRGYRAIAPVRKIAAEIPQDLALLAKLEALTPPFPACDGDEPYVFVCYSHHDRKTVYPELVRLHDAGVNVWYDEGISPGSEWSQAIADAIQGCSRFLYFVSPRSVDSENCRRELNFAQEEGREVVAIHLEPTEIPGGLRLNLNNRQAILRHELTDEIYRRALIETADGSGVRFQVPAKPKAKPRSARALVSIVAVVVIVAAGAFWSTRDGDDALPATIDPDVPASVAEPVAAQQDTLHNSIAVLPFDNLSPDPDNAYFAAGIHEEVLNQLSKIKDLSVIARATMVRYANSDKSVPEIGEELKVSTVMDGSVRYAGNRVRITTQLIDAVSGAHLWSEAYEEDLEDIFGIQLAIATRIAGTLEAEFSPAEQARIANRTTDSPEAYAHYLKARTLFVNFTPTEPVHEALDAAIAIDPEFTAALAFKAFVYGAQGHYGWGLPEWNADHARRLTGLAEQYARRVLELDDQQASAHHAMNFVYLYRRNWDAAVQSIERAYALQPNDFVIATWTGRIRAALVGDMDGGFELVERAVRLNPGDYQAQSVVAELLARARRWEDAVRQMRLMDAMAGNEGPSFFLGMASAHAGDIDTARQSAENLESGNYGVLGLTWSARLYAVLGDTVSAKRVLELVAAHPESDMQNADARFWMYLPLEEHAETAMNLLEAIIDENYRPAFVTDFHAFSDDPGFDPVRSHPKFDELVRRVSTPFEFTE